MKRSDLVTVDREQFVNEVQERLREAKRRARSHGINGLDVADCADIVRAVLAAEANRVKPSERTPVDDRPR